MTTRWPSGCLYAVSSISNYRNASSGLIVTSPIIFRRIPQTRQYVQGRPRQPPPPRVKEFKRDAGVASRDARVVSRPVEEPRVAPERALPQPDAVKSAFNIVSAGAEHDPINPPRSTLPPRLASFVIFASLYTINISYVRESVITTPSGTKEHLYCFGDLGHLVH